MEIDCTLEELKSLIKETPVAGTTDVVKVKTEKPNINLVNIPNLQSLLKYQ